MNLERVLEIDLVTASIQAQVRAGLTKEEQQENSSSSQLQGHFPKAQADRPLTIKTCTARALKIFHALASLSLCPALVAPKEVCSVCSRRFSSNKRLPAGSQLAIK